MRDCCDLHAMRRRSATALAGDRATLHAYRTLWHETPQLIPFYFIFIDLPDLTGGMQPTAQLKATLLQRGITPVTWRLVANCNAPLILQALHFYASSNSRESVLDYLLLLQLLGFHRQPPWFMWNPMLIHAHSARRIRDEGSAARLEIAAFRRIVHLYEKGNAPQKAKIREFFNDVIRWIGEGSNSQPIDIATFRHADWDWFLRKAEAWKIEKYSETYERRAKSWQTPFDTISIQGYTAIALNSPFMLWKEAVAMHHCVETYRTHCRSGKVVVVSIRSEGRRRPVATLSAKWQDDHYILEQAVGFSNRSLSPNMRLLADRIVREMNSALQ
jgi:hypothetical protein